MTVTETPVALQARRSYDRKVSPLVRRQKHNDRALIGNSFGLPAGKSCPGRTPFCDGCYAEKLEKAYTSTAVALERNWQALQACGEDVTVIRELLSELIIDFADEVRKRIKKGQATSADLVFRPHWDGDFYSASYTAAWGAIVRAFPQIQFWIYTRSFDYVPILADGQAPNLALYLSVDERNIGRAGQLLERYPRLLAAYCATTQHAASALAKSLGRVSTPCPENIQRIPLVMPLNGRRLSPIEVGQDAQGACISCGLCVYGLKDVGFSTTNR